MKEKSSTANIFIYVHDAKRYIVNDAFVARISVRIETSKQLFEHLDSTLNLPGYFGLNWDALYDCLRDFHWIEQHKIVIIHDQFPLLKQSDAAMYLSVLHDAVLDWKSGEEHSLEVIFDAHDHENIRSLMSQLKS